MKTTFWLSVLVLLTTIIQFAILNPSIPLEFRPELGLYLGLAAFSFLAPKHALLLLFFMGVQADLLDTRFFGCWTVSYLAVGGLLVGFSRELHLGGQWAAWPCIALGTGLTHICFQFVFSLLGSRLVFANLMDHVGHRMLVAAAFGWFCAHFMYRIVGITGLDESAASQRKNGWAGSPAAYRMSA